MISLCFVCLGNICRSPIAAGVMRHLVRDAKLEGQIQVASAGTAGYHSTHLPFPALTITMATPTVGWSATATEIYSTTDGGATWTKVADVIPA